MDVLPIVAPTAGEGVELAWRLIALSEDRSLHITVSSRGAGVHPTSAWIEETSTHVTLHVVATGSATPRIQVLIVTPWEVHLPNALGNRFLHKAAERSTGALTAR